MALPKTAKTEDKESAPFKYIAFLTVLPKHFLLALTQIGQWFRWTVAQPNMAMIQDTMFVSSNI